MFSVVITTKNRIEFLIRAVNSITNNTITPSEIIIVNDGGCHIPRNALPRDIEIIIINNDYSKGANYCRNLGIQKSTNDIVFLLDDDDALSEISFESRLKGFSDERVGISYTGIRIVSDDDLEQVKRVVHGSSDNIDTRDLFKCGNLIGSTSRVAVRKSYFMEAGMFDEDLQCLQDYDLWIRMASISDVYYDSNTTVLYTVHRTNAQISKNPDKYILASSYLLRKYKDLYGPLGLESIFKSNLYLRVAISSSNSSVSRKMKYSLLSFYFKPNVKSLVIAFVPCSLLKKLFHYV